MCRDPDMDYYILVRTHLSLAKRRTSSAPCAHRWTHPTPGRPRRVASSICPNLICDKSWRLAIRCSSRSKLPRRIALRRLKPTPDKLAGLRGTNRTFTVLKLVLATTITKTIEANELRLSLDHIEAPNFAQLNSVGRPTAPPCERCSVRLVGCLNCRRVATRYDKFAANYLAFIQLASIRLWLCINVVYDLI